MQKIKKENSYMDVAFDIGLSICRDAIWYKNRCTWITASQEPHSNPLRYFFKSIGPEFYDGTAGIAFFLGHLSKFHEEPIIRKTAEGALRQSLLNYEKIPEHLKLGFFSGYPGIAYVLFSVGLALECQKWAEEGRKLVSKILKLNLINKSLDVIGGLAGAIPVLIHIYSIYSETLLKNFILELGETLFFMAEKDSLGWSWKTLGGTSHNLTGFSHGSAGFTNAMLELWVFSNDEKYLDAAYKSHQFENRFFDTKEQNWLDLRKVKVSPNSRNLNLKDWHHCCCFWCHGAPGIGLSRKRAFQITNNKIFLNDLKIAVQTTINKTKLMESKYGFSLCHGVLGNAELFLNANAVLKEPSLMKIINNICKHVTERYFKKNIPIPNGIGNDYQIPSFMTGMAGIGYFFLRTHSPCAIPSILSLDF